MSDTKVSWTESLLSPIFKNSNVRVQKSSDRRLHFNVVGDSEDPGFLEGLKWVDNIECWLLQNGIPYTATARVTLDQISYVRSFNMTSLREEQMVNIFTERDPRKFAEPPKAFAAAASTRVQ